MADKKEKKFQHILFCYCRLMYASPVLLSTESRLIFVCKRAQTCPEWRKRPLSNLGKHQKSGARSVPSITMPLHVVKPDWNIHIFRSDIGTSSSYLTSLWNSHRDVSRTYRMFHFSPSYANTVKPVI